MKAWIFAWSILGLTFGLLTTAVWLAGAQGNVLHALVWVPLVGTSAAVGFVIATHRARNPVGWMLLAFATITAELIAAQRYAALSVSRSDASTAADWAAWLGVWPIDLEVIPLLLALLLFPTGKLPSRRWRPLAWTLVLVFAGQSMVSALTDANLTNNFPTLSHPLELLPEDPSSSAYRLSQTLTLPLILAVMSSLVVRYRRAAGSERQQIKWLALAGMALAISLIIALILDPAGPVAGFVIAGPALPLAIGAAILRYRLYDIDLVINRTLVYGTLTGFLGLVYVGGVVGLSQLVPGEDNDPAVAAATLAVAALFSPARRRIQAFVDRRFYRSRYDARRTLEAFGSRLREEVELETLLSDLQAVVQDTLHPSRVGVWLREQVRR